MLKGLSVSNYILKKTYNFYGYACEFSIACMIKHSYKVFMFTDVFGQKSNVSLVFDFMDTDLEIIVKDNNIVLTPANVKAYMIMTLKGKLL